MKIKTWTFYKWCLLIVMVESLKASFFWNLPYKFMIPILFILIAIIAVFLSPELFSFNRTTILLTITLYIISLIAGTRGNLNAYLGALINAAGLIFFAGLRNDYKVDFIHFFTRAFSILVGISLLGWFLFLLGVNLPNFYDTYGFSEIRNEAQYQYQNYYVFLLNIGTMYKDLTQMGFSRFSSVFLEPGYFGMILAILLYLNNFNLKNKSNIIFLVALIFTFSLSGWLLAIFTYIAYRLRYSNKKISTLITISIFSWVFVVFFTAFNDGNNVVYKHFISRLEYDESKGTISGYNRTSEDFDDWFNIYFLKSPDIYFGLDMNRIFGTTTNIGWKVYMVNYGIVGMLLYLLFLFYVFYKHRNFQTFIFMILYILIFIRGHHVIYFTAFPILYLGGCTLKE